jgi:hypothetical protein
MTGTGRMARASLVCLLVCLLLTACNTTTRRVALNTSDGKGNVVGFGEHKLGSNESELDKAGWTVKQLSASNSYSRDMQYALGGKLRDVKIKLLYTKGKELRFMVVTFNDDTTEQEIHSALVLEYGSKFPKEKHELTDGYRFQSENTNLIQLIEASKGHPQLLLHWKGK